MIYILDNVTSLEQNKKFEEYFDNIKFELLETTIQDYRPSLYHKSKYEKDIACQTSLLGDEFEEIVKLFAPVVRAMFPVLGTDKVLVRNSRFNLIDNKNSKNHTPFHRDLDCDHWVAVYYLNDADGDTIIFDEGEAKYVFPKRDRMVFWPGQFHAIDLSKDIVNRKIYNFSFTIKNPA